MSTAQRYERLRDAAHALIRAKVSGLGAILRYEPRTLHAKPVLYSLIDGFTRSIKGQIVGTKYIIIHRLCVVWQDNERAEDILASLIDPIPNAIQSDRYLGGTLTRNDDLHMVVRCETGWVTMAGTIYRNADFYHEIMDYDPLPVEATI